MFHLGVLQPPKNCQENEGSVVSSEFRKALGTSTRFLDRNSAKNDSNVSGSTVLTWGCEATKKHTCKKRFQPLKIRVSESYTRTCWTFPHAKNKSNKTCPKKAGSASKRAQKNSLISCCLLSISQNKPTKRETKIVNWPPMTPESLHPEPQRCCSTGLDQLRPRHIKHSPPWT